MLGLRLSNLLTVVRLIAVASMIHFSFLTAHAQSSYVRHVVREKQSLSSILYANNIGPIYGPGRKLEKALQLNPNLKPTDGSLLYPGQVIFLPVMENEIRETASTQAAPVAAAQAAPAEVANAPAVAVSVAPVVVEAQPTPAPVPVPVVTQPTVPVLIAAPKAETREENLATSDFGVQLLSGFTSLEGSNETNGKFISSGQEGVAGFWQQNWSDSFRTQIGGRFTSVRFEEPASASVLNSKQSTSRFHFGAEWGEKVSVGVEAFAGDTLLYRSLSASVYELDKTQTYGGVGKINLQLVQRKPLKLNAFANYGVIASQANGAYPVGSGTVLGGGFQLKHSGERFSVIGATEFDQSNLKLQNVEYTFSEIRVSAGVVWSWK